MTNKFFNVSQLLLSIPEDIDNNIVLYDLVSRVPIHQLQTQMTVFGALLVVLDFSIFYPRAAYLDD